MSSTEGNAARDVGSVQGGASERVPPSVGSSRAHYTACAPQGQGFSTPVHDHAGRPVGEVVDAILYKTRYACASKHMLREPKGWSFDLVTLAEAEAAGARWVILKEQESGAVYRASLRQIRDYGLPLDRGCGAQLCLVLSRWAVTLPEVAEPQGAVGPVQLDLFGAL